MTWVRLDDQFSIHRKTAGLTDHAFRLHVSALCWSARNLADGYIDPENLADVLPRLRNAAKYAAELVDGENWHLMSDSCSSLKCPEPVGKIGWRIHDYFDYQFSKEQVTRQREANRARVQRHRNGVTNGITPGVTNGISNAAPVPSRPVSGSVVTELNAAGHFPVDNPRSSNGLNGAATRQPPPFAQAVAAALNPPTTWDAFTRPEPP